MVAGDREDQVNRTCRILIKFIKTDIQTLNIIRLEQLREVHKMKNEDHGMLKNDLIWDNQNYLFVPNPNAYFIEIPDESIGTILGTNGSNLVWIKEKTQVHNLHLAADCEPGVKSRKLYVEGSKKAFLDVKQIVADLL